MWFQQNLKKKKNNNQVMKYNIPYICISVCPFYFQITYIKLFSIS